MKKEELLSIGLFLLTPLREGRRQQVKSSLRACVFLLTPLREGRHQAVRLCTANCDYFYSRPCGRGDLARRTSL